MNKFSKNFNQLEEKIFDLKNKMYKRSKGRNINMDSPSSQSINIDLSENKMQTLMQGNHK